MQHPHLPMIIDSFAGGGGASTGIEQALGPRTKATAERAKAVTNDLPLFGDAQKEDRDG